MARVRVNEEFGRLTHLGLVFDLLYGTAFIDEIQHMKAKEGITAAREVLTKLHKKHNRVEFAV